MSEQQKENDPNSDLVGTDADVHAVDMNTQTMITIMQDNGWFLCGDRLWHPRFPAAFPRIYVTEFRRHIPPAPGAWMTIDCVPLKFPTTGPHYPLREALGQRRAVQEAFNKACAMDRRIGIKWEFPFNDSKLGTPEAQTDAMLGTKVSPDDEKWPTEKQKQNVLDVLAAGGFRDMADILKGDR